jgi:shikimate kinase
MGKKIIIIAGPYGAGKTTFGSECAREATTFPSR